MKISHSAFSAFGNVIPLRGDKSRKPAENGF
jgi:ureidoglycolate hydrolase